MNEAVVLCERLLFVAFIGTDKPQIPLKPGYRQCTEVMVGPKDQRKNGIVGEIKVWNYISRNVKIHRQKYSSPLSSSDLNPARSTQLAFDCLEGLA